jgi:hypothetical protein
MARSRTCEKGSCRPRDTVDAARIFVKGLEKASPNGWPLGHGAAPLTFALALWASELT